jgi:hypothetical protein
MTLSSIIQSNKKKYETVYQQKSGVIVTAEWHEGDWVNQIDQLENKDSEYNVQLATYHQQCSAAESGFDNIPAAAFDFGREAYLLALAYGCPVIKISGLVTAEHLYKTLEDAEHLQKVERIWQHGLYPVIFERIAEFQNCYGDIPISISDNQSPNDALTSILNSQEAMIGMFTDKDRIHRILGTLTDSIIEINRHFEHEIRNFAGFHCARGISLGMHISDDNAAFLSPDTYAEFSKPYNERLAEEFGGIVFHCCMGYEQNLENMASTKNFLGFDAMPDYNDIDKVLQAIHGRGVWNVYNFSFATKDERRKEVSDEKWFKNIIDRADGRCGLILNVNGDSKEEALRLADTIKNYAERQR